MALRVILTAVIASLSWPMLQVVQQSDWFDYLGFELPVTSFTQHIELVYSMATSPWLSTLSSLSSISSISPGPSPSSASSSTTTSVNEVHHGPSWCGQDGVTDVLPQYYYYYCSCFGRGWYQYYDVCSSNVENISDSEALQSTRHHALWWLFVCVTLVVLCALAKPLVCSIGRALWLLIKTIWLVLCACRYVARNDLHEVWQAVTFLACQLVLILSKRVPTGAGRLVLRRFALHHRPYAPASLVTGEVEFLTGTPVRTPIRDATTPASSSSRRSLLQIQFDQRVVAGGATLWHRRRSMLPAKMMRRRRLCQRTRSSWRTVYNPSSRAGDCLFMSLGKVLGVCGPASAMRRLIKEHAQSLLTSNKVVHDNHTLCSLLRLLRISPETYLRHLAGARVRWGNTIDVIVASDLFQQQIRIIDLARSK
eukprot:4385077-Amphidinium_carterae.1